MHNKLLSGLNSSVKWQSLPRQTGPGGPARSASFNHRCYGESHYFIRESALTQLTHSSVVPHPFWAPGWRGSWGIAFPGGPQETTGQAGQGGFPGSKFWAAPDWTVDEGTSKGRSSLKLTKNSGWGLTQCFRAKQNKTK